MRRLALLLALTLVATEARAQLTTDALIDSLQHRSFGFFWSEVNPANGLIRDRSEPWSACSIAAQGFGLSAICVAIDHGWITRAEGRTRVLTSLQTFWNGPQGTAASGTIGYKGFFYHFLDMGTARRSGTTELSTIDTALLLAGVIDTKQYFTENDPDANLIRALADSIYYRVDWTFLQNPSTKGIKMGWKPEGTVFGDWIGYNEAMILYLLAFGSPTHPTDSTGWNRWTSNYFNTWGTYYGQTYLAFGPLFGHQYSHCWVDFRGSWDAYMQGKGLTYFENSRRATYAQRAYAIANPLHWAAYSDSMWGMTAGDGPPPTNYRARGAPPDWFNNPDDGTISPTAPISSIAFAPELAIPVIRNLYNTYGSQVWGDYAFTDAFNPSQNWWDVDVLGIDQGPMVLMIENWRNNNVWTRMMANADLRRGMQRAGFVPIPASVVDGAPGPTPELMWCEPNPFVSEAMIRYRLPQAADVRLAIYDVTGREVARLASGTREAGFHEARWSASGVPNGIYYARLEWGGRVATKKLVRVR